MNACFVMTEVIKTVRKVIKNKDPAHLRYELLLRGDHCQIMYKDKDTDIHWFFFPNYEGVSPTYSVKDRAFVYRVSEEIIVHFAISMLQSLLKLFPGYMSSFVIDSNVFDSETNILFIFSLIKTIKRTRNLEIDGDGVQHSAVCSRILNELIVSESIIAHNLLADDTLRLTKVSMTPCFSICLSNPTPMDIINCAGKRSVFSVGRFTTKNVNELLKIWLTSNLDHISTLILNIKISEEININDFFFGLVNQTVEKEYKARCCGSATKCNDSRCLPRIEAHLQNVGVRLKREDCARAIVSYSPSQQEFSFSMIINYPNKPNSIETIQTELQHYTEELNNWKKIEDNNLEGAENFKRRNITNQMSALISYETELFLWEARKREHERAQLQKQTFQIYREQMVNLVCEQAEERAKYGNLMYPR